MKSRLCRELLDAGDRALLLVPLRRDRKILGGLFRMTREGDPLVPVACRVGDRHPLSLCYQIQLLPLDAENYAPQDLYVRDLEREIAAGRVRLFLEHAP